MPLKKIGHGQNFTAVLGGIFTELKEGRGRKHQQGTMIQQQQDINFSLLENWLQIIIIGV